MITDCVIHSDAWFYGRLSKLTASEWYCFMGEKLKAKGAQSYIFRKVGETLSGIPSRKEISTESTEHGHIYEKENLIQFMKAMNVEFMVQQKLITEPESPFGCTPDALIVISEKSDKTAYQVQTVEAKCPGYEKYIRLAMCKTAEDVKSVAPEYFWQCLFQISMCDALYGYLSCYQPFFKSGGLKIIQFDRQALAKDFKNLEDRKRLAVEYFNEVHDYFLNLTPYDGEPLNIKLVA